MSFGVVTVTNLQNILQTFAPSLINFTQFVNNTFRRECFHLKSLADIFSRGYMWNYSQQ